MFLQINRYAIGNITRRKTRSLFAIVGIAVGISSVIALVAISNGLLDAIRGVLRGYPGDVLVIAPTAAGLDHSLVPDSHATTIAAIDGVEWAEPFCFKLQNYPMSKLFTGGSADAPTTNAILPIYGIRPDGHMMSGFPPPDEATRQRDPQFIGPGFSGPDAKDEVLFGWSLLTALRAYGLDYLPKQFVVGEHGSTRWRIVGSFRSGGINDTALVVPYRTLQDLAQLQGRCSAILVKTNGDTEAVVRAINRIAPDAIKALPTQDFIGQFGNDIRRLQSLVFAIGFIAALAGAIGVLNTMMSNVHERTREIGLLQAVGWRRGQVMLAVMAEGFCLSAIGGLLAMPLGLLLIKAAEKMIEFDPVPTGVNPMVYLLGLVLSLALGLVGSILPAWRASRLSPVQALRES
ncbi:MAG: ABC transporter permease [Planctomycetota bacterium]